MESQQLTHDDVKRLTERLSSWASTNLDEREQLLLAGVLELAGKMYEGTQSPSGKRTLPLKRESIRDLQVWDRLLETQGHSLWTCDKPPSFEQFETPKK
ncbi:hypothetical protein PYH37_000035 [Sinorhizobium numidicum]|uniref:Uncharacterized protein n=1 Tax=Sinorhizobium numidicum TaxID=680248 RepID=A0ABY8CUT1_9HYPH|nr:hypothetical protein [Sinorhizobium numidicum]WEX74764.1 hypothetical protein PYH37_000035 [Sinorhizobium numidicum]WEX80756.1 hypothetical protein PYH38_000037 [Sinorhizobium numidicum]